MKRWLCVVMALFSALALIFPAVAAEEAAPLSPALAVLAKEFDFSLWALVGEAHEFSPDVFERGLNLSSVKTVSIRSIPPASEGVLRVGKAALTAGATLDRSAISNLTFESSAKGRGVSTFSFVANASGVEYTCKLYTLRAANASPGTEAVPTLAKTILVHKNLSYEGTLRANDPEGDALSFEVVSYPKYGSLMQSGDRYVYKPFKDYTGSDGFSYVARDLYGNYSAAQKVGIEVTAKGAAYVYSDVEDTRLKNALMTLGEAGVMSGEQVGNTACFFPDRSVSRAEFLVMAMNAAGIADLPTCLDTGFADDVDISPAMKPYVAAAYRLGYIKGNVKEGQLVFLPNLAISKGEGALLLQKILLPDEVEVTAVGSATGGKEDARQSVEALAKAGLFDDGITSLADPITRGETAKLLADIVFLTNRKIFQKTS